MNIFGWIKNAFLIVILVVGVYFVANFAEPVKNQALSLAGLAEGDVKGATTQKAEEISSEIGENVNDQVATATNQALNIRIGDIVATLSRVQRIPQDVGNAGAFVKEQVDNMLQSREQKEGEKEKKRE